MPLNNATPREDLKKYFQTGDRPTENQFAALLESYAHLNEFNFGISAKATPHSENKYYHFYKAVDYRHPVGHLIEEGDENVEPELTKKIHTTVSGDTHGGEAKPKTLRKDYEYELILSRQVFYKKLEVELNSAIDIENQNPRIIIERYRQTKQKMGSAHKRANGYLRENKIDAEITKRQSEIIVDSHKMVIDLEPIRYFRPAPDYKDFKPSGSLRRRGSYLMTKHYKPFECLRMRLQIQINGTKYLSQPVYFKVLLGTSDRFDPINFIFD